MPAVVDLRCEFVTTPLGLDEPEPRLSWRFESSAPGARQVAYQVTVGSQPGLSDYWDSGKVEDRPRPSIEYKGKPVPSATRAYWQVTLWDQDGTELTSEPSWWETGLLTPEDWHAQWIQGPLVGGPHTTVPAAYLWQTVILEKPIQQARLYITALGLYEAQINGVKVGDHHLAPGWTDTRKRLRFQTFDVTDLLAPGENELSAVLGDGWYCGHLGWRERQYYGDRPKLLAQLEILHPDGTATRVVTDGSWRCGTGPILEADLLMGESYDARRPITYPWPVEVVQPEVGKLVAPACPPVRKLQELRALSVTKIDRWPSPRWIFDFGQNLVGHVRLKVTAEPGQDFTIRHGEVLDKDGKLYTENLRFAKCTDYYCAKGEGEEVWEPVFTFHGFRYIEVTGFTETPSLDVVTAVVVHSDLPQIGTFECSDPLINQLQSNILWGWRGNSVDVPTDCPQRDERLGWTGDAQVFAATACFNTFALTFFEKYVQDLEDAQFPDGSIPPVAPYVDMGLPDGGPAWADAFVLVPWAVFQAYGDTRILKRHYPAMVKWMEQQERTSKDFIRCYEGYEGFTGFGDWLSINAETPKDLIGTAYFAHCSDVMGTIAHQVGDDAGSSRFKELRDRIEDSYQRNFTVEQMTQSQTAAVLSLFSPNGSELARPHFRKLREALVKDIEERGDHLSTGFIGAPWLLHALSANGLDEIAYRLLEQKTWPSWLYPVTQGATTIWERWDGWTEENGFQDAGMNSFNHYAYGSVGEWLYRDVTGLRPMTGNYQQFSWLPCPGGTITWAKATVETAYGRIEASWQRKGDIVEYELVVPPSTLGIWGAGFDHRGEDSRRLEPGTHRFTGDWPPLVIERDRLERQENGPTG